jgi:quercetin dioxygenase-like cupin family protein
MRVLHLDDLAAHSIEHYGSRNASVTLLARGDAQVVRVELGPGGVLGMHPASVPQLFVVVSGSGRVRVEGGEEVSVAAGSVVFWRAGEMHESRAEHDGLVAVVVEAERLDAAG